MGEKDGIVEVTRRGMAFDLCVVSFRRRQKRLKPFLELLCPFVTLSKRGIEPLWLCNTVYLRARRSFAF